jgi:hypothetical protein
MKKKTTIMTVVFALSVMLLLVGCATGEAGATGDDKLRAELLDPLSFGDIEDAAKTELNGAVKGELPMGIVTYTLPGSVSGKSGERIYYFLGGSLFQASFRNEWPAVEGDRAVELGFWTDAIVSAVGDPSSHTVVGDTEVYNWAVERDGTPTLFIASLVADTQSSTGGYVRVGVALKEKVDVIGGTGDGDATPGAGRPEVGDDAVDTLLGGLRLGATYEESSDLLGNAIADTGFESKGLVTYVEHGVKLFGFTGDKSTLFLDGELVQTGFSMVDKTSTEGSRSGFVRTVADNVAKIHGMESLLLKSNGLRYEWRDATVGGVKSVIECAATNPMDLGEGITVDGSVTFSVKEAAIAERLIEIYRSFMEAE